MLRCNGGQDIFFLDQDRYRWSLLIQEGVERHRHRIHGFCLMTNHAHVAIQVGETPLAKILQNPSFRYTQWVNRRRCRMGHLFQRRYKQVLADGEAYLLELVRYIHLNPARAGLLIAPDEYLWTIETYESELLDELEALAQEKIVWLWDTDSSEDISKDEAFSHASVLVHYLNGDWFTFFRQFWPEAGETVDDWLAKLPQPYRSGLPPLLERRRLSQP